MISGGNATIFVSSLDRAVEFYTEVLGLKLDFRSEDYWAQIDAGDGLKLGLHHDTEKNTLSGKEGSVSVGFNITEPIETVVQRLEDRGAVFHGAVVEDGPVKLAFFGDPDGNALYLCEYDKSSY